MKRGWWISLTIMAVVLSLLLSAANLFLGNLNQDEGWYLYAARLVSEGRVLYRDFMFTQGPALPAVYGIFTPVIHLLGVAGGRLITALFGLAAAGCAAWLAARAVSTRRHAAALCAFILTGVNVYQSYFSTIVKTYALCAFFITAGFAVLSYAAARRGIVAAFFSGILLALAACTRLSAGILLPVAGIWLILNRRKIAAGSWAAFGSGGGLMLLAGLGIFFLLAPENTHFALFGYHAGRSPGGLMPLLALKAGFISRFVQAYFVFAGGVMLTFFFQNQSPRRRELEKLGANQMPRVTDMIKQAYQKETPFTHSFISLLWISGAAVTLVHFAAPFPYDDYQVIIFPLLAAALAATLLPFCPEKYLLRTLALLLLVNAAAACSSPVNQEWLVSGRDRIWWKFKETPDLITLRRAGNQLREKLAGTQLLLTQDIYLAVETGATVPHGMEMGPFCYYPELPRRRAEKLNLLNTEMLIEILLEAAAPVAAFSGYGLSIASPEIAELPPEIRRTLQVALEVNYDTVEEIENFGQAHTTLKIYERK